MANTLPLSVPLPRGDGDVVVAPERGGDGYWAGGPSAVVADNAVYLAYRLRRPVELGRGYAIVIARSTNGLRFEPIIELRKEQFATASFERPALVRVGDGSWRLFVSCSTENSKHWWIDALAADRIEDLDPADRRTVFPGDATVAAKDPVVREQDGAWQAWVCCHPLDEPDATDRMYSRYATSADGWSWQWGPIALQGRAGRWDARGARISEVLVEDDLTVAYYDGRANAEENWKERTGIALAVGNGIFQPAADAPTAVSPHGHGGLRYVCAVRIGGRTRLYYEACRADGAHELRTELFEEVRGAGILY